MEKTKLQFIYTLKLIPKLIEANSWTKTENEIVDRHFTNLQGLLAEGKLILAGRTQTMDENTFGIVILEVDSEEEAQTLMKNDPAVAGGVMTAELFPYKVALIRK